MKIVKVVFCFLVFCLELEWVALRRHNGKHRGSFSQEIKTIVIFFS